MILSRKYFNGIKFVAYEHEVYGKLLSCLE
jgi:hypothetical protein